MRFVKSCLLALALISAPTATLLAAHHEEGTASGRAEAVVVEARVVAVDLENREFSLEMPQGAIVTMKAGPVMDMKRLEEVSVGDIVIATYLQSLAAEVRAPTQEELDEPWVELDAAAVADLDMDPGVAGMRVIRAVCSIEGMNRVTRTVMIEDPRGKYHLIGDVDPARMMGLTLGTRVIIVYTEALALSLEKQAPEE